MVADLETLPSTLYLPRLHQVPVHPQLPAPIRENDPDLSLAKSRSSCAIDPRPSLLVHRLVTVKDDFQGRAPRFGRIGGQASGDRVHLLLRRNAFHLRRRAGGPGGGVHKGYETEN
ncbi:unnamed protein product [Linum trigynum]|uniref:Uncharacterized protein n=1 Tax=Linum trigynum TaxID=586398 RepID=A0AAV2F7Q4_9ROSI